MIDAACAAIRSATGVESRLIGFNVSSVTGGIDALGDVVVQLEADGAEGVGPRGVDRRGRSLGPCLPGGGQPPGAYPRPQRRASGRDRPLSQEKRTATPSRPAPFT